MGPRTWLAIGEREGNPKVFSVSEWWSTKKMLVQFKMMKISFPKNGSLNLQGRREAFRIGSPTNKQILGVYSWIVNHVVSFLRIRPKKGIGGWGQFFSNLFNKMGMEITNYCSHSIRSFKRFWGTVLLFVIRRRVLSRTYYFIISLKKSSSRNYKLISW